MNETTKRKIIDVFEKETRILMDSIDPRTPIREQISIDSMQFISIIAHLEQILDITIPTTIMGIDTLEQFYNSLDNVISQSPDPQTTDNPV